MRSETSGSGDLDRIEPHFCLAALPANMNVRRFGEVRLEEADPEAVKAKNRWHGKECTEV